MKRNPDILLIYTGGTIGMIKDFETGALHNFNFEELLQHIPELQLLDCNISTTQFGNPIDSSDMNPEYWSELVGIIEKHYEQYDGFVVLHGSDTMSFTASALSFMLENLAKPVIFTGSQLPIGDLRTDAKENLITAVQIAALQKVGRPIISEVCLYFEYKLYRANRTTKVNTEHFEAFDSPNYPPLAESGVNLKVYQETLLQPNRRKSLVVHRRMDTRIVLVKMFPGMSADLFRYQLSYPDLKGVVMETYGSGNVTTEPWLAHCLKQVIKRGIPVVNITQCNGGGVDMGVYATSIHLKRMGVISGKDLTSEAALTKMMYLLGQEIGARSFKTLFETAIRGEMA